MIELSDTPVQPILKRFASIAINTAVLVPTETGMQKSIMDATESVRRLLRESGLHDYSQQEQGGGHKILLQARVIGQDSVADVTVSVYRPLTKSGDPRIWIYGLSSYATVGNLLVLFVVDQTLHIVNASNLDVIVALGNPKSQLSIAVGIATRQAESVAEELLSKLRGIALSGPIPSVTSGDTGVGMTLEHALKIPPNSEKTPDYKGIELKASRSLKGTRRSTRVNLFAQVPDWKLSNLKSSSAILDRYGYKKNANDFRLYCTVSALKPNSQSLILKVDFDSDLLHERAVGDDHGFDEVAIWRFEHLRQRLLEKHPETYWVKADSTFRRKNEYFHYTEVVRTKSPKIELFPILIDDGTITVDHLIKRLSSDGKSTEKGPLFKISPTDLKSLMPDPTRYDLLAK